MSDYAFGQSDLLDFASYCALAEHRCTNAGIRADWIPGRRIASDVPCIAKLLAPRQALDAELSDQQHTAVGKR